MYDEGINAVLQFDGSAASDLSHRYLWSNQVDGLLADEQVTSPSTGGNTLWGLGDHLGTLRDIADLNESSGVTSVTNHRTYNAFGKLTAETNAAVDLLFGYTGKQLDDVTGLQHNLFRWYDSAIGQWINEDPLGFAAHDGNVRRYVGNRTALLLDPLGLDWLDASACFCAGWGDAVTFGTLDDVRENWGINGGIDHSSSTYGAGFAVGVANGVAIVGVAGLTVVGGSSLGLVTLAEVPAVAFLELTSATGIAIGIGVVESSTSYPGSLNASQATIRPMTVTADTIREAMADAPLLSQQAGGAVSLPMIKRYVEMLEAAMPAPAIHVDGNIIVDGNHRYIAGILMDQPPPIQPWTGGDPSRIVPWKEMKIDPMDWDPQ